MSYSRWSTTIGFEYDLAFPCLDVVDQSIQFFTLDTKSRRRLLESQRAYCSSWYVYWSVESIDAMGRKGQVLWIGSNRVSARHWHAYTYDYCKLVALRNRWSLFPGYAECQDHRDCFHLAQAVRDWLSDVEESYPA